MRSYDHFSAGINSKLRSSAACSLERYMTMRSRRGRAYSQRERAANHVAGKVLQAIGLVDLDSELELLH